jgi:hypothetical protein
MTPQQTYKLKKAIDLIKDVLKLGEASDFKNIPVLTVWLHVAGTYCNEIAEEIKKSG